MSTDQQNELLDCLQQFENALGEPVVVGEEADWVFRVDEAAGELEEYLQTHFTQRHEALFAEINEEDPAQNPRTNELRELDQQLLQEFHDWRLRLRSLADHGEKLEPEEPARQEAIPKLVENGLRLIVEFRRQEIQLVAWLSESLCRERGFGD